ncbi:hypothetical protein ABZ570_21675 [Micromonospora sp. NPDC007271]|uniref:hypothetical protein n=1 Tax=Micromonospora sp. NPDC007271 TaxID=3154587 RepID=UPI0034020C7A
MSDRELYCDTCEGVVLFEAPPGLDGAEPEWFELACTGCGSALLIAGFAAHTPRLDRRRGTRPTHRRAA